MACESLMAASDSYNSCCDCWKHDEQWSAKKKPAQTSSRIDPASRVTKHSGARPLQSHYGIAGKTQQETVDPRKVWKFCHLEGPREYMAAYRQMFTGAPADDCLIAGSCCAARTLKRLSMRMSRSKIPHSSQLYDSIVIIGVSKNGARSHKGSRGDTVGFVGHYLTRGLGTWKPDSCEQCEQQRVPPPAELIPRSAEIVSLRDVARDIDSADRRGRLLAGKLKPVSIVERNPCNARDRSPEVKVFKCAMMAEHLLQQYTTRENLSAIEKTARSDIIENNCPKIAGPSEIWPLVGEATTPKSKTDNQSLHFRSSIATRLTEPLLLPPNPRDPNNLAPRLSVPVHSIRDATTCPDLGAFSRGSRSASMLLPPRRRRCPNPPRDDSRRSRAREPFKGEHSSENLQCFLRSKQRRCLHYRRAVLGEGFLALTRSASKKWSSDCSIVPPN